MDLPGSLARPHGNRQNTPFPGAPGTGSPAPRADRFRDLTILLGILAVLSAVLGLAGIRFGITILSTVYPGYRTIALSAALIWIITGSLLALYAAGYLRGTAAFAARVILGAIIVVEFIELGSNISGSHSGIETWLTGISEVFLGSPAFPISPAATALIIPASVSLFLIIRDPGRTPVPGRIRDAVGICGSAIVVAGFTFVLSYVFGDPLLYGTRVLPIAAISALAALFLGAGLVTAAGPGAIPLRYVTGDTTRAGMLRIFVPLVVVIILVQQVVFFTFSPLLSSGDAILTAGSLVLFALVTGYIVSRISGSMGGALDRAETALLQKNEDLGAMNEELTALEEELRQNIEELQKSETALRENLIFARNVLNNLFSFVGIATPDGRLVDVNRAPLEAAGITAEMCRDHLFWDCYWWSYDPDVQKKIRASCEKAARGETSRFDVQALMEGGSLMWLNYQIAPLRDSTGQITHLIPSAIDITNRKRGEVALEENLRELSLREQELNEALAEKEVLLSEIHHRVKNNLTAFISLLSLEGSYDDSPAGSALKKDLQNRARSMALIHETLYRTGKYSRVDMDLYLKTLTGQVTDTYVLPGDLQVHVEAGGVVLDLSRATTCGLIVNELVTNSLKYAFSAPPVTGCRPGRPCMIAVTLIEDGGEYIMRIRDNGIGLPPGMDVRNGRTLGLKLVNFLADYQLHATISVRSEEGTEFELRFPVNPHGREL